jgi:glycosyltransferase involved in cell wall biosynthesis
VVFQDADFEYFPEDVPALLAPIRRGEADVVFGSRFATGGSRRVGSFWHARGNQALTLLSNVGSGLDLTDMACGYKAFRRSVLERLAISENGFGVEAELTAKIARQGRQIRLYEVPIRYAPRSRAEGKKIRWRDGLVVVRCIVKYSMRPKDVSATR